MRPEVVWITGASAGLGKALVETYVQDGATVAATARPSEALDALVAAHPGKVVAFPADITDAAAIGDAVMRIETEVGPIRLAILNAGTHQPVKGAAFKADELDRLVQINLIGTAHCLEAVLQPMLRRRQGQIAVVSSVAGYTGLPTSAYYGATKAALFNMCESLKFDFDREGIDLRVISPGFVRTPLTDKNDFPMPFLMEPDAAARRVVAGLRGRRFEVTFPRRFTYGLKLLRILPYALYFALLRRTVRP
ncbi:MAG: SDR family NAD(P)-dependent oxidoreductase [Pseudomonadota bacterium]